MPDHDRITQTSVHYSGGGYDFVPQYRWELRKHWFWGWRWVAVVDDERLR